MIVMIIIHQLFLLKVGVITDVTREGDRNKVSSWGSGREFIGRFIVNINLGSTEAETKAVIFHSSSLFMDPLLVSKKMNTFTKLSRESSIHSKLMTLSYFLKAFWHKIDIRWQKIDTKKLLERIFD